VHPAGPYDLFAGQDLVVLARYDGDGAARLRFEGRTADGPVSWEADVTFPERTRENSFVPRLWATQRVGWLAAEKRAHGGSAEIDAEIRELGERYGIPTEFTSYFVPEPGLMADLRGTGNAVRIGRAPVPAAPPAESELRRERFEAARTSAEQRDAKTLSGISSMQLQTTVVGSPAAIREAANRTFVLHDGLWTDGIDRPGAAVVRIRPYSDAYFTLIERLPLLGEAFSLGERVRMAGRQVVIEVAADGVERLSAAELRRIETGW
jgi:Ca-activated chloride channel family protein